MSTLIDDPRITAGERWGSLEPEEEKPAFYCQECGRAIYPGEDYYDWDGRICEDCVLKKLRTA